MLGSIPAAGLYFGSYEFFKSQTLQIKFFENHPFLAYLSGGMFAETVACIIFVPVDVIKERRQVQMDLGFKYKSDFDAVRSTVKSEGIRGLYRAYGATVFSFGPFSALYFYFYETFKGMLVRNDVQSYLSKIKREGDSGEKGAQDMSFGQSMLCSMGAGALASVITNPLDMAKLRLQVQRGGSSKRNYNYKHLLHAVIQIGKREGALALFRGSLARCLFHIPMTAISMSVLESTRPSII